MQTKATLAAAMALLALQTAHAGPDDYAHMPGVEYGEREIDLRFGRQSKGGEDALRAFTVGFGYGVTERWFTELYLKYNKEGTGSTRFDAWEWENKLQLTETGQYPVDLGLLVEFERPKDRAEGYELRFGPLLQSDFGQLQANANLLFERHYRAEENGPMEIGYQAQLKYRWTPAFEFGAQAFGEMGKWNHWEDSAEQNHRIGPAVFGKLALGAHQAIKYNAALLTGISRAAPNRLLRAQMEYEF